MKSFLIITATIALFAAAGVRAEEAKPDGGSRRGPGGPGMTGALLPEKLLGDLALTADQSTKYKALDADFQKERDALRAKSDPAEATKLREEMKAARDANDEAKITELRAKFAKQMAPLIELRKASMDKVRAILTDDQKKTLDEAVAKFRERRGGPGGAGGPPK